MTNPFGANAALLPTLQLIADALLPVLRAFRDELGDERANAIAARGLAEWRRGLAAAASERVVGNPRDCWEKVTTDTIESVADTVDIGQLSEDEEGIRFEVTGCEVARYFHDLGEAGLGFELGCAHDLAQAEALGRGAVTLERVGTLMEGAPCCDFRYRFQAPTTK